ncbi:hypothetical protein UlMin_027021 [Ulmus minor]
MADLTSEDRCHMWNKVERDTAWFVLALLNSRPGSTSDLTHINNSIDKFSGVEKWRRGRRLGFQRNKNPSSKKEAMRRKKCLDSSYSVDLHKSISSAEKLQASLALELEKARQEKLIAYHRYNNKLQRDLETTSQSHSRLEMVKRTIVDNLSNFRGHNKPLQDQLTCLKASWDDAVKQNDSLLNELKCLGGELQQVREDHDRLVTEIRVLTIEVAKYKEFIGKSCAKLDNLILFNIYTLYVQETCSSQRQRICVLEHQLIAANEKLKMADLSTSETRIEVEEQKRIVRDLQDRLVDAHLTFCRFSSCSIGMLFTLENLVISNCIVCIFSYGQIGSGKTYTMMGRPEPQDEKGFIPRSLEQIFQTSQSQIYNETICDLLATNWSSIGDMIRADNGASRKQYAIKHDANGNTHVYDLTIVDVSSIKAISSLLHQAAQRSHVVFTLCISGVNEGTEQQVQGVLNLIDFAGSERLSRSGAIGDRLKETQAINKSLSSLTDVIFALAKKEDHVPFKNSKLTFLLQTLMFVKISPDPSSVGESLCSLKFTTRVNN